MRQKRGAVGVEKVWNGKGVSSSGFEEASWAPQRGPGHGAGKKRIWCILSVTASHLWLQDIVNHENSVLEMQNYNIQLSP